MLSIEPGEKYPGKVIPSGQGRLSVTTGRLLLVLPSNGVAARAVAGFEKRLDCGIYHDWYPLVLWRWKSGRVVATPFNPQKESSLRPLDVDWFLNTNTNIVEQVLVDKAGIVLCVQQKDLPRPFLQTLRRLWTDPNASWTGYDRWLADLLKKKKPRDLWALSETFQG